MLKKIFVGFFCLFAFITANADTGSHAFDLSDFKPAIVSFANLTHNASYQLQCWLLSPSEPVKLTIAAQERIEDTLIPAERDFMMVTRIFAPLHADERDEIHYALSSGRARGFCELTMLYD